MNQRYASRAQEVQCFDCRRTGEKDLDATRAFLDFRSQAAVRFLAEDVTARGERVENQSWFQSHEELRSTCRAVGERPCIAGFPKCARRVNRHAVRSHHPHLRFRDGIVIGCQHADSGQ
jgi:hypothetical protein